ncbi:uncharacterized protein LOC112513511 [Cynara cardunculus var. scolymus]|uniref:uncharacterized protein LOC112513511 n=1 Tax=Cynara cardunculus var. scolymus TaxID=59895 RepID=UPI000D625DC8|nr:uncharacterized protein LOC112513511 [Cynara cardunculus var. scolymus]
MEKLPAAKHEKRSQKSSKKKPVKVVYISNPMKIKATPSEFRAVVQQLTGQYATSPPLEELTGVPNEEAGFAGGGGHDFRHHQEKWQRKGTTMDARFTTGSDLSYEYGCREDQVMDDLMTPQMLQNYSPSLPSDFESS